MYLEQKILKENPFQVVDRKGVGKLMDMAVKLGRATGRIWSSVSAESTEAIPNPVEFCHIVGLDYVSCSPFRYP